MDRRDFLTIGGLGLAGLALPIGTRAVAAEELLSTLDVSLKKSLADAALEAATKAGASYCDVRVGRYLRQFVLTREDKVENVVNTESTGIGVRVIVNGTWGFAATSDLSQAGAAAAATQAAAIARANSRVRTEPVQLAKVKGAGEVAWSTPIRKNAMAVPIKEKAELLLAVNAAALKAGAEFRELEPVRRQRAEVLRLHRRLLHRPGHPSYLGAVHGNRSGQGERQVPHARRLVVADGHGLGVHERRPGRATRDAQRRGQLQHGLRHGAGRDRRGPAGPRETEGAVGKARQVRPRARSLAPLADDPRVRRASPGTRPRARLRGQLCRHQLCDPRQAEVALPLRQRQGHAVRRPDPAEQPRRRSLR